MSLTIHLLGRPRIESLSGDVYQFRSRKSWALLAFLILNDRPPSRRQLASLLFSEADDPLRALRWNLSEIRRSLGEGGSLEGDPVVLRLPADSVVDVALVAKGAWYAAVDLPGLGSELLDGIVLQGAPAFESWLLSEQRHVAAASEAILHEAALGSMSRGDKKAALGYAMSAAMMSPLDENHQALVIRLYRLTGDDAAAEQQFKACSELFDRELGVTPGPIVQAALRETRDDEETATDPASVAAIVEAGSAAVAAGAVEAGVQSLRAAVRLADGTSVTDLRVSSRLVLAEALGPFAPRVRRGRARRSLRSRRDRTCTWRPCIGGPRTSRSWLRRLPARPLRPCRTVVDRCSRFRGRLTVDDCEGNDVPRLGRKRSSELCESCQPPRAGDRDVASRRRASTRGLRTLDAGPNRSAPQRLGFSRRPPRRLHRDRPT